MTRCAFFTITSRYSGEQVWVLFTGKQKAFVSISGFLITDNTSKFHAIFSNVANPDPDLSISKFV